jgi:RHS repeat-associated protein
MSFSRALTTVVLLLTIALLPAQAQWGQATITSPGDGDHFTNASVTVFFNACATSGSVSSADIFLNNAAQIASFTTTQCFDWSVKRRYSKTVTLVPGANFIKGEICRNTESPACYNHTITVYYDTPNVSVTPDGGGASSILHGASGSHTFTVTNSGQVAATANLTSSCSGHVVSCSAPTSPVSLNPGASATVTVSYTGNVEGTGTAAIRATYAEYSSVSDSGFVNVQVNPIFSAEIVTTHSHPLGLSPGVTTTGSNLRFRVRNTSQGATSPTTFSLTRTFGGILTSCPNPPSSVQVNPGDETELITLTCDVGATTEPTTGYLTFSATAPSWSAVDSTGVNATPNYQISLSQPSAQTAQARVTAGSVTYTISNNSVNVGSTTVVSLSRQCLLVVSCEPLGPSNNTVTVPVGGSANVTVDYGIYLTGTIGSVSLTASKGSSTSTKVTSIGTTPDYKVIVTRTAADTTLGAGATSATAKFTITNNSTNTGQNSSYTFTPTCTGPFVTGCNGTPASVTLGDQQSTSTGAVALSYNTGSFGTTGTVKLKASASTPGAQADSATTTVNATPSYAVSVLPESTTYRVTAGDSIATLRFTVTNTSVNAATASSYALTTIPNGQGITTAACTGLGSVTLSQGQSSALLSYSCPIGAVGSAGNLKLRAATTSPQSHQQEQGTDLSILPWYSVTSTPAQAIDTVAATKTLDSLNFTVRNASRNTSGPITFSLAKTCGPVISCPYSNNDTSLAQGTTATIKVKYSVSLLGTEGSLALKASASSPSAFDGTGSATIRTTPFYGVAVTRSGNDSTLPARSSTVTPAFVVRNLSTNTPTGSASFTITTDCNAITACPGTNGTLTLGDTARATYSVAPTSINWSGQAGRVKLTAASGGLTSVDSIRYTATPFYEVTVQVLEPNKSLGKRPSPDSTKFRILNSSSNTNGAAAEFTLTAACAVAVSCTFPQETVSLAEGTLSGYKTVNFSVGAIGTQGTVQFNATAPSFNGSPGISTVTPTPDYTFEIVPTPLSTKTLDSLTTSTSTSYLVRNTSANTAGPITFTLAPACAGVVSCSTNPTTVAVAQGADSTRSVSLAVDSVGITGSVTVIASASSPQALADTAATSIQTTPAYRVAVTPISSPQTLGERVTSGLSVFTVRNKSWNTSGPITFGLGGTCTLVARPASCAVTRQSVQLAQWAQSTDTVTFSVDSIDTIGSAVLTASATTPGVFQGTGTTSLQATPSYRIAVTPANNNRMVGAGTPQTFVATITNTSWNTASSITASLSIGSSCSNVHVGSCSLPSNSTPLSQGQSTGPLTLSYDALAPGSETITLDASGTVSGGTVSATDGLLAVTVSGSGSITATTAGLNPHTTIDRGDCLTIAAGQSAVYECGDLRVAHALPAITTMGKARSPTLIYNSRHANPRALLAANVTYTGVAPLTLRAIVTLNGQLRPPRDFTFNSACEGQICRIVVPIEATVTDTTGVYTAQMQVEARSGTYTYATSAVVTDTVVIVDRRTSYWGAGWWLQGLERVYHVAHLKKLWVGGDGSTRLYTYTGNQGSDSVFVVSPAYDRPDTLRLSFASPPWLGRMKRLVPNGAYVEFYPNGLHNYTYNVQAHRTSFQYLDPTVATSALQFLTVPTANQTGGQYQFYYTADGSGLQALDSVKAPRKAALFDRITKTTRSNHFTLTSIIDKRDMSTVSFAYDASGRMIRRKNVLADTTFFQYDDGGALTLAQLDMSRTDGTGANITATFRSAETRSATIATDTLMPLAKVYTLFNGPRPDSIGDTTRFYVNRRGAPDSIANALNQVTKVVRGNAAFPALVTSSIAPNGLTQNVYYNPRALVDSAITVNPYGDGRNPKTTYTWHSYWNLPTKVKSPAGDSTMTGYHTTRALPTSRRIGPNSARRDSIVYNTTTWQVVKTIDPFLGRDSVVYDGTMGNVIKTISPMNFTTEHVRDGLGRDTLSYIPTDSAQTPSLRVTMKTFYGLMDRVDSTEKLGPPGISYTLQGVSIDTATIKRDTLRTSHSYDNEGKPTITKVTTSDVYFPEPGVVVQDETWTYDAAGRLRTHRRNLNTDSTFYDEAGNVKRTVTKGGGGFTQTFDALNRPLKRITAARTYARQYCEDFQNGPQTGAGGCYLVFPAYFTSGANFGYRVDADTASFTYDASGNMMAADNHDARIRRGYFPNGALRADTSWIRDPHSDEFYTSRRFVAHSHYDIAGRRDTLTLPDDSKTFAYTYTVGTGELSSIVDPTGTPYRYVYDLAGRVDSIVINADSVVEKRWYDADHRQNRRVRATIGGGLTEEHFRFDAQGRIKSAYYSTAIGPWTDSTTFTYSGLGAIIARERISLGNGATEAEEFRVDGLGNVMRSRGSGGGAVGLPQSSFYGKRGVLTARKQLPDPNNLFIRDSLTQKFDADGHLIASHQLAYDGTLYTIDTPTRYYYGNDGKLHAMQRHTYPLGYGAWEEYRYDALGRRVMVILRGNEGETPGCGATNQEICNPPCSKAHCESKITAQYWDGDQLIKERRSKYTTDGIPNVKYGMVHYVHGLELDKPLAVLDNRVSGGSPRLLNANWRGTFESSVSRAGDHADCAFPGMGTCLTIPWPANGPVYQRAAAVEPTNGTHTWSGSLLLDGQDASGNLYRRNRYYDPVAGRFTQEDPIGLAGGMNLYGFAGGDPVNFTDPFGLDPYVNCRPVKNRESYGHCGIRVIDSERNIDVTFELSPEGSGAGAPFGRKTVAWSHGANAQRVKDYHDGWTKLALPEGMSAADFDRAILNSALKEQGRVSADPYLFTGETNSNRFVRNIIVNAGGSVPAGLADKFPKGAPGLCGGTGMKTGTGCSP